MPMIKEAVYHQPGGSFAYPLTPVISCAWNTWLQGDPFDAVMNYLFRESVLRFFASGEKMHCRGRG